MPRRFFIHQVMFEAGIAPFESSLTDMNRVLRDVDPLEARKLKRKFRKLWRNCMRKEKLTNPSETRAKAVDRRYGVGSTAPEKRQLYHRKCSVFFRFHVDTIDPLCALVAREKNKLNSLFS